MSAIDSKASKVPRTARASARSPLCAPTYVGAPARLLEEAFGRREPADPLPSDHLGGRLHDRRPSSSPASWDSLGALLQGQAEGALRGRASVLITINWGTYIWAVNSGHVTESSLGYYVNPLVSVALGALFLRERMDSWTSGRSASRPREWPSRRS